MDIKLYRAFLEDHISHLEALTNVPVPMRPFSDEDLAEFIETKLTTRQKEAIALCFSSPLVSYSKVGESMGITANCARQHVENSVRPFLIEFQIPS